jgi:hypothetical protein
MIAQDYRIRRDCCAGGAVLARPSSSSTFVSALEPSGFPVVRDRAATLETREILEPREPREETAAMDATLAVFACCWAG